MSGCSMLRKNDPLPEAPKKLERYNEIAVVYQQELHARFNSLSAQERVFIYYLWRAGLPGYRITVNQMHRCAQPLQELFELFLTHEADLLASAMLGSVDFLPNVLPGRHTGEGRYPGKLKTKVQDESLDPVLQRDDKNGVLKSQPTLVKKNDIQAFMQQVRTNLVYLWTNHGQYFLLEHEHNKRTPHRLDLDLLTKKNISTLITSLGKNANEVMTVDLEKALFDDDYQATLTFPGSINKSAVNIYGAGFGDHEYSALSDDQTKSVNAYFCVEDGKPVVHCHATNDHCSQEMSVMHHWLEKAYKHAQKYPANFDEHIIESLKWLLAFVQTGDEAYFKNYSRAWLKTQSRIDFNFGFIETYHDPKNKVGLFQAEATIKTLDMTQCNKVLFHIEQNLPLPPRYHRLTEGNGGSQTLPNASLNTKLFAIGDLGPLEITAAYCLPNYEDIRAKDGSKQIMYPAEKGLGALLHPEAQRRLFHCKQRADWLERYDQDGALEREIWDVQCLLHETIGHGSGRLAEHTFKPGDSLCIAGTTYHIGDTIPVTNENVGIFLDGYDASLEELRAEIIALYASVTYFDDIAALGYFKRWHTTITKIELLDWLIEHMAFAGLTRLINQKDGTPIVQGDHARADYVILNYLLDHGALEIVEEQCILDGQSFGVVDVRVLDLTKALDVIKTLMIKVQTIKSTGDEQEVKRLFETYGTKNRHETYAQLLKANRKKVNGDLKVKALLTPIYKPECDKHGAVVDVHGVWPKDIFDYFMQIRKLELSKL